MLAACNRISGGERKDDTNERYGNTDTERSDKKQSVIRGKKLRIGAKRQLPDYSAIQALLQKAVDGNDEQRKHKKYGEPCCHREGIQKSIAAAGIVLRHSLIPLC